MAFVAIGDRMANSGELITNGSEFPSKSWRLWRYGEIVDVNLVRDKGTGKSKGSAFVAYEGQRSTILAVEFNRKWINHIQSALLTSWFVYFKNNCNYNSTTFIFFSDNLNGAQVLGRTIRVDHVAKYKKKEEEDEEAEQQKREARGVCRAFQRGECTRGAGCKFSHNEQRAANTGWGAQDAKHARWKNDKYEGPTRGPSQRGMRDKDRDSYSKQKDTRSRDEDTRSSRPKSDKIDDDYYGNRKSRYDSADDNRRDEKRSKYDSESYRREYRESDRRTSRDHSRKDEGRHVRSHRR
ncbi:uncharacterized protein LOC143554902 [Bidens hawaiensis]|uniref:uncharacterized protein LOC143554902 n=1 Tax=Bidens hawaiensis TaxID=980011 RepID=UPI00404930B3